MSVSDSKIKSRTLLETTDAKWVKLVKTDYTDPNGKPRTWESAERRTRPATSLIDGVGIVAILEKASGPELLLQKQFRPPVDKVCIEVPAGLVDEGESPEVCALRELKEETGYVGELMKEAGGVSPLMYNGQCRSSLPERTLGRNRFLTCYELLDTDPGFCNTNLNMVHVKIDMSRPENQDLKPQLEENEFIQVFSIPLKGLYAECGKLEKEGYAIDARVGTLAEGFELARKWKL
ncbi:MAG: hypothetical protein M4579_002839 [Chaenotheca gracillima]|nr:MAG: hypothetical protein M4579_002839 [Chaenotheca gracillima]